MDHLLTVTFDTPEATNAVLQYLRTDSKATNLPLDDICVASRDADGDLRIQHVADQVPQHEGSTFWRRLVHDLAHVGDAAANVTGPLAELPESFVRQIARSLQSGRPALLALTNGTETEPLLDILVDHGTLLRCELGEGGREAFRQQVVAAQHDPASPTAAGPSDGDGFQAAFGSFQ